MLSGVDGVDGAIAWDMMYVVYMKGYDLNDDYVYDMVLLRLPSSR